MDCENESSNWNLLGYLPSDIIRDILSYVGSKDIFNIYCSAKNFSFLIHDHYVWWVECRRNSILHGPSSNRTRKTVPKWFTSGNWYHEFQWRYTQVEKIELKGHKDIVWDVKHLPVQSSTFDNSLTRDDQYKLLSVSDDGTMRIWSADTPTSVYHHNENNISESVPILSVDVIYSSNHFNKNSVASSIVTGSGNGMMSVWDTNTMQKTSYSHSNNYVNSVRQLNGFGGFVCMSSCSSKIYLWDFRVPDPVMIKSHSASILSLTQITNNDNNNNNNNNAINFDILSSSRDKSIRGWNIRTMSNSYLSHISNPILSSHFDRLSGHVFLGGGFDNRPTLFHRNLAEIFQGLPQKDTFLFGHKNRISSITGDNLKVVTAGYDHIINLWDRHSDDIPVSFLSGHRNFITSIHLSSDSTSLVSSSADNTLRLYHLKNNFRWNKEFVPVDVSEGIEVKSSLLDQHRFFPMR